MNEHALPHPSPRRKPGSSQATPVQPGWTPAFAGVTVDQGVRRIVP